MSSKKAAARHAANASDRLLSSAKTAVPKPANVEQPTPNKVRSELAPDSANSSPICDPVQQRGRMTPRGYQPENHQWLTELTDRNLLRHGKLTGRDPSDLDIALLVASGHPFRRTRELVAAKRRVMGEDPSLETVKRSSDIRTFCLGCSADDENEVTTCACIDCAFWAYRTGKNPHNPRRGKLPEHLAPHVFAKKREDD